MKPAPFAYHDPATVDDVVGLLGQYGDEAKPLAGGQSLVPLLALRLARFEHLIDLNSVEELFGISRDDGHLRVGSMTRQSTAERDATAAEVPLLSRALPWIGHFQIRNRGTIGGSIAHADPASELPAVALALDAEMDVIGPGGARTVPASEFFEATFMTSVGDDEILRSVRFPVWSGSSGASVKEFARRSGDFAIAGVTCALEVADGKISKAGIGFLGMGPTPMRATQTESNLTGTSPADADWSEIADAAVAETDPGEDIHASAAHRRRIGAHLAAEALAEAASEAQEASK